MPGTKTEREDIWQWKWRDRISNVENGTQMLIEICDWMRAENAPNFARLPEEFNFRRKPRFRRSKDGLDRWYHFEGTQVWLDTNMKTIDKKEFARALLRHFGFNPSELDFRSSHRMK